MIAALRAAATTAAMPRLSADAKDNVPGHEKGFSAMADRDKLFLDDGFHFRPYIFAWAKCRFSHAKRFQDASAHTYFHYGVIYRHRQHYAMRGQIDIDAAFLERRLMP